MSKKYITFYIAHDMKEFSRFVYVWTMHLVARNIISRFSFISCALLITNENIYIVYVSRIYKTYLISDPFKSSIDLVGHLIADSKCICCFFYCFQQMKTTIELSQTMLLKSNGLSKFRSIINRTTARSLQCRPQYWVYLKRIYSFYTTLSPLNVRTNIHTYVHMDHWKNCFVRPTLREYGFDVANMC